MKNTIHKKPKQQKIKFETIRLLEVTKFKIQQYALTNKQFDYEAISELVDTALEKKK